MNPKFQTVAFAMDILNDAVQVGLVEEGEHLCVRVLADSEAPAPGLAAENRRPSP